MEFKHTLFLMCIVVLETVAEDDYGKDVVSLGKDSFRKDVAKMPHFVMFFDPE